MYSYICTYITYLCSNPPEIIAHDWAEQLQDQGFAI